MPNGVSKACNGSKAASTCGATDELKQEILELVEGNARSPLSQKVKFYKSTLAPLFAELSQRNSFSEAEEQVAIVLSAYPEVKKILNGFYKAFFLTRPTLKY